MWGAIIGDLAGSIYEYGQVKNVSKINVKELIEENSFYSDDTILTIAILEAALNNQDYEFYLKKYAHIYKDYKPDFSPYFKTSFSPSFIKWSEDNKEGNSTGNGAMMRISAIGYLFDNEDEVIKQAKLATIPSHNSEEAINCATIAALVIFYARKNYSKEQIIEKLNLQLSYKPFERFNTTCYQTISNCLYAVFTATNFEDAIKKVISYGGDTDTNACIVGAMAESIYEIDKNLILKTRQKLPLEFIEILDKAYKEILK